MIWLGFINWTTNGIYIYIHNDYTPFSNWSIWIHFPTIFVHFFLENSPLIDDDSDWFSSTFHAILLQILCCLRLPPFFCQQKNCLIAIVCMARNFLGQSPNYQTQTNYSTVNVDPLLLTFSASVFFFLQFFDLIRLLYGFVYVIVYFRMMCFWCVTVSVSYICIQMLSVRIVDLWNTHTHTTCPVSRLLCLIPHSKSTTINMHIFILIFFIYFYLDCGMFWLNSINKIRFTLNVFWSAPRNT